MAVYTKLNKENIEEILSNYSIGNLKEFRGIEEGIENTNYFILVENKKYILTIYEKRVKEKDLPFFSQLMSNLNKSGFKCPVPIESKSRQMLQNIGRSEGMIKVGDQRNEVLSVDRKLFRSELIRQMDVYDELDAFSFFKLVHSAYNKAIGDYNNKKLIFYHIHNPDEYAQLNFCTAAPKKKWVMMVRDPAQNCESAVRDFFNQNDHQSVVNRISSMLFEIDNIIYHKQVSIGIRLEDLKEHPRKTIPALCKWMGVKEEDSLYEMTAQGKKWWGDPSSPDYEKDGMEPFGKTSIKRKIGSIFSKNDQFILQTLFYPFSVRFGYRKENEEQFKLDLQRIRPMIDEIFDFEKKIAAQTETDLVLFMKSGARRSLRSTEKRASSRSGEATA